MVLNIPNVLTVSRILAIPVVLAFIAWGGPLGNWLAFSAYTYACITDFFDGYLARAWHQQSAFGRFLDPIADKLLVAGVLFMLVGVESVSGVHILPAAIILCREILVSGLREFLAEARVGLPVSLLAKWKTTIQMLALGFLIVGNVGPDFGFATTWEIGVYGLWIAALITIITGYDYLRAGLRHIAEADAAAEKNPEGN
ncbi:CDP-diacylglycerol--glycerol-3-phosphate 3-phosphatidyltransferase [Magnetovibrio blakemorei]|uniref:CDP-diacylglycerol--glycerol-3-phosphate 3-phosphatidyltransferase n=1 Tax=Magnetovibrio blakemorei TaxID=28181 RepID=A0A1E5Q7H9_9PROT|nr:CDP-diacylglycerol--glycerol-3-phosphate 3-phosphatidyltransferase [Magnetovibrio blakemorei]OEJ67083.1 CDP-diacylglycerol--glycerol-3-phosphate 3-phosphatidyltransferase [Magnetovibrio blakemorei]